MTVPLIQFNQVFKSFGDNTVLKGVDLSIYQGQVTAIIGKSGIGKSVLLKHIIGLLEPDAGEIQNSTEPVVRQFIRGQDPETTQAALSQR